MLYATYINFQQQLIGVEAKSKMIDIEGKPVKLQLYDTVSN